MIMPPYIMFKTVENYTYGTTSSIQFNSIIDIEPTINSLIFTINQLIAENDVLIHKINLLERKLTQTINIW